MSGSDALGHRGTVRTAGGSRRPRHSRMRLRRERRPGRLPRALTWWTCGSPAGPRRSSCRRSSCTRDRRPGRQRGVGAPWARTASCTPQPTPSDGRCRRVRERRPCRMERERSAIQYTVSVPRTLNTTWPSCRRARWPPPSPPAPTTVPWIACASSRSSDQRDRRAAGAAPVWSGRSRVGPGEHPSGAHRLPQAAVILLCSASAAVSGDWRPLCVVTPRGRRPGTADRFD